MNTLLKQNVRLHLQYVSVCEHDSFSVPSRCYRYTDKRITQILSSLKYLKQCLDQSSLHKLGNKRLLSY